MKHKNLNRPERWLCILDSAGDVHFMGHGSTKEEALSIAKQRAELEGVFQFLQVRYQQTHGKRRVSNG